MKKRVEAEQNRFSALEKEAEATKAKYEKEIEKLNETIVRVRKEMENMDSDELTIWFWASCHAHLTQKPRSNVRRGFKSRLGT